MSDDIITAAIDRRENWDWVRLCGVRVDLATFNLWAREPARISATIAAFKRLQVQLADAAERNAAQRAQIRELSEGREQ
jgi:hypothetical protein